MGSESSGQILLDDLLLGSVITIKHQGRASPLIHHAYTCMPVLPTLNGLAVRTGPKLLRAVVLCHLQHILTAQ
jgi:hypothetical protein